MGNTKAVVKHIDIEIDKDVDNINESLDNLAQKDYDNYAELDGKISSVGDRVEYLIENSEISPGKDIEVLDARVSAAKGKTFVTVDGRLEEIETDIKSHSAENAISAKLPPYNAVMNGTVDDTTPITSAIADSISSSRPMLPFYKAKFDKTLNIPKNLKVTNDAETAVKKLNLLQKSVNRIAAAKRGNGSGSLTIVSDSKGAGNDASAWNKNYPSLVKDALFNIQKGGYGYELLTDMQLAASQGFAYAGNYTHGTKGASKKSIVLQPNATITFTRDVKFIDFIGTKSASSGSLEIRKDGVLVKTVSFNNATTIDNFNSFTGDALSSNGQGTYEIKCITNPVEIYGILTLKSPNVSVMHFNRVATSGYASTDYTDSATLDALNSVGSFYNSAGLFVLEIGTNDIFAPAKAVSVAIYKNNLKTIANGLLSRNANNVVVLCVPPYANPSTWTTVFEHYCKYKNAVYELALELQLGVIDFSEIDFIGNAYYSDGIHFNDNGHFATAMKMCKDLTIPIEMNSITYGNYKRIEIPVSSFYTSSVNKVFDLTLTENDFVTGVYIKNTTNGLIVPYQDVTDYANGIGLSVMRGYSTGGLATAKLYYVAASGFCKTGRGALGSLLTNTAADATIIVEYITR